jgi:hypothetical protein
VFSNQEELGVMDPKTGNVDILTNRKTKNWSRRSLKPGRKCFKREGLYLQDLLPVTYAPLFFYVFSSSGLGGLVSSLFETNSPFHGGLVALLRSVANNFWFLLMEIGGNPLIQKKSPHKCNIRIL